MPQAVLELIEQPEQRDAVVGGGPRRGAGQVQPRIVRAPHGAGLRAPWRRQVPGSVVSGAGAAVKVLVTGATGFTGGHLATLAGGARRRRARAGAAEEPRAVRSLAAGGGRRAGGRGRPDQRRLDAARHRRRRGRVPHRRDLSRGRAARRRVSRHQRRRHPQRAGGRAAPPAPAASCTAAPVACTATSRIRRRTKTRRSIRATCTRRPSSRPKRWRATSAARPGFDVVVARPIGIYGPGDMRFLKMFRGLARGTLPDDRRRPGVLSPHLRRGPGRRLSLVRHRAGRQRAAPTFWPVRATPRSRRWSAWWPRN